MLLPLAFFFGGAPSTPELLLVLLAILLLFGAKRLPEIARSLGKTLEEFKRAARDVTDEILHADTGPTAKPAPLPPAQALPSDALARPVKAPGQADDPSPEVAEKPAAEGAEGEASPDQEHPDVATS